MGGGIRAVMSLASGVHLEKVGLHYLKAEARAPLQPATLRTNDYDRTSDAGGELEQPVGKASPKPTFDAVEVKL